MGWLDTFLALILGTLLYVGGYQIYFYAQDRTQSRSRPFPAWARTLDECLPFVPQTVWAYTLLYYPAVVIVAVTSSHDWQAFAYTATSYLALLGVLTIWFFILPVTTPPGWRSFNPNASVHHKHLAWVQKMDGSNGCFPSGHAAISTLTGGLLAAQMGLGVGVTFAVLVCLSCVLCKQHYILDIVGGVLLGLGCLWLRGRLLGH
jgi:membrane-associated phospholipid phosphatase